MPYPYINASGQQQQASQEGSLTPLLVTGGIFGAGFIPFKSGRMWDVYLAGIRAIETAFPAAILRTLKISELLSPLESYKAITVPPNELRGGIYSQFLKKTIGGEFSQLTLRSTSKVSPFGELVDETGNIIGLGLRIKSGTQKGSSIADYYARVVGMDLGPEEHLGDAILRERYNALEQKVPYSQWLDSLDSELKQQDIILGERIQTELEFFGQKVKIDKKTARDLAQSKILSNIFRAKAAADVGRLNTLLSKPLDVPVIGGILNKIPLIKSMAVRPGTAMEMLTKFAIKGTMIGGAWKGLEYIDYLRSQNDPSAPILSTIAGGLIGGVIAKAPGAKLSKTGLMIGSVLGAIAGVSPRFDNGIFYGAASIPADINVQRAGLADKIGLTESLKQQEDVTPGLVSVKTAIGFGGVGALLASTSDYFSFLGKSAKAKLYDPLKSSYSILDKTRLETASTFAEKVWGSSFGKTIEKIPGLGKITKIKSPAAIGFLGGVAAWQILSSGLSILSGNYQTAIPGAPILGGTETEQELQDIYSGKTEIPVRKGRFWELGRSSDIEGGRVDYFRPHFLANLKSRAYEKGVYGSEEEKWEYDPWLHPLDYIFGGDEFKYHYELKHMYDRPAPITSTFGEEIPFVGPIVSETFGKLIKPRKLIRPEEWVLGEGQYKYEPSKEIGEEPVYPLGGLPPGAPVSPDDYTQKINEFIYKYREATGLAGYTTSIASKITTGREEVFPNLQTLEEMGEETTSRYWWWKHLNVGGGLFSTEALRRFIPSERSYLETYNPLKNNMPSWIPDDYFMDLKTGNPFEKLPEAEIRLPGPGLATRYPELEGVEPENYPLPYRVKVLGDIAMYSKEYSMAMGQAKKMIDQFTPEQQEMILETEKQVRERRQRKSFKDYRFNEDLLKSQEVTVTEVVSPKRFKTKELGGTIVEIPGIERVTNPKEALNIAREQLLGKRITMYTPAMESRGFSSTKAGPRLFGMPMIDDTTYRDLLEERQVVESRDLEDEFAQLKYSEREQLAGTISEKILHGIETPLEYLTPMSPAAKLIRQRSPVEEYAVSEAIATQAAFWDRPIEHFIQPTMNLAAAKLGNTSIPENVQERRNIQEYFDMLKWVKYSRLEKLALQEGDFGTATEFRKQRKQTVFGVDAFNNPFAIQQALPRQERDYYKEFVNATSEEEQQQILSLIPENERRLYSAQWMKQAEQAALAKRQAGIDNQDDLAIINSTQVARISEGFDFNQDMVKQYYEETEGKEPFDEWIRNKKAEKYFETHPLPPEDSIAWHPAVDLEDVKAVYVAQEGLDFHDFGIYQDRINSLLRKQYIDSNLISEMSKGSQYDSAYNVAKNSEALATTYESWQTEVQLSKLGADIGENRYNIEVRDGREDLVESAYKKLGA